MIPNHTRFSALGPSSDASLGSRPQLKRNQGPSHVQAKGQGDVVTIGEALYGEHFMDGWSV